MPKITPPEGVVASQLSDDTDETSRIRRLPSEFRRQRGRLGQQTSARHMVSRTGAAAATPVQEIRDTIPCAPPAEVRPVEFDLERTIRFARLVRETLTPTQDVARLLDLAIMRRDAVLLQAILRQLYHSQQQALAEAEPVAEEPEVPLRPTILPPAPTPVPSAPPGVLRALRKR